MVFLIASINEQVVIKNDKDLNSTLDCLKVCGKEILGSFLFCMYLGSFTLPL